MWKNLTTPDLHKHNIQYNKINTYDISFSRSLSK